MKRFIAGIAIGMVLAGGAVAQATHNGINHSPITVRWCPEDAVHVGVGDFNGTRWEAYRCIPRDDIVKGGF